MRTYSQIMVDFGKKEFAAYFSRENVYFGKIVKQFIGIDLPEVLANFITIRSITISFNPYAAATVAVPSEAPTTSDLVASQGDGCDSVFELMEMAPLPAGVSLNYVHLNIYLFEYVTDLFQR